MPGDRLIIPRHITILDGAFATDGGSISLLISDPQGNRHSLLLSQHLLPFCGMPGEREPGRLHLDGSVIPVRSAEEASIISALEHADIELLDTPARGVSTVGEERPSMVVGDDIRAYFSKIAEGPEAAVRHLVLVLIEYVGSEEYVALCRRNEDSRET